MDQSLDVFFEPKSVAIVGASRTPGRPGYCAVENLATLGFEGKVYPINPQADEILGWRAYPKISQVQEEVELVYSLASPAKTPKLIEDCAAKGVKGIVIASGGFKEASRRGADIEEKVVEMAQRSRLRIVGPNVTGPVNLAHNFVFCMAPIARLKNGPIALVCQTSVFVIPHLIKDMIDSCGISKGIDLGNKSDVDDAEVIEYLQHDPQVKVIAIHMEGIKNGEKFVQAAKEVSKQKPIILFKTGRSEVGSKATASHSGSIMNNDAVLDAAFKQAGIIRAGNIREFLNLAKIFALYPPSEGRILTGNRIGLGITAYGASAMMLDLFEENNLQVAGLSNATMSELREITPSWAEVLNPFDLGISLPNYGAKVFRTVTQALLADENVDGVLLSLASGPGGQYAVSRENMEEMADIALRQKKPLVINLLGSEEFTAGLVQTAEERGIPVFSAPEESVNALGGLWRYYQFSSHQMGTTSGAW